VGVIIYGLNFYYKDTAIYALHCVSKDVFYQHINDKTKPGEPFRAPNFTEVLNPLKELKPLNDYLLITFHTQ